MRNRVRWMFHRWFLITILTLAFLGLVSCASTTDWVNFIKYNGITYVGDSANAGRALTRNDLGPQFATVKSKLSGNVTIPGYQLQDGDAAFLNVGTPIYTMKGYKSTFRLAAYDSNNNNRLVLFEADTNPNAKRGSDLLDIGSKVQYIGVNKEEDGTTQLGAIKDPNKIALLTQMVLTAYVDQSRSPQDEPGYFISFYLKDNTVVTRGYGQQSRTLDRGILLPEAFGVAIQSAVSK